jgi:hypothetical protein
VTQIFIIAGTSWTVPADWSSTNTIECIGGGGGGGNGVGSNDNGGGGGGGYAKVTNVTGLSGTLTVQVGAGGTPGNDGGQTWFNGASAAAASVSVNGGKGTSNNPTGGLGGTVINGTCFAGGQGGTSNNANDGGAGGGGAGGPSGAGQTGGPSAGPYGSGGGGAAANLATAGSDGGGAGGHTGGAGGTAQDGTAGGAGAIDSSTTPAQAGSRGSGGGGGAYGVTSPSIVCPGAAGGNGVEWDSTHGSGGGGGGSGYGSSSNQAGNGGNYGGGGGGSAYFSGYIGGTGGNGIIVITYTPAISATIVADSRNALEHQSIGRMDALEVVEFGLSVPSNVPVAAEGRREIRCDGETPIEASCAALGNSLIPVQWAGSLAFYTDALMPFEAAAGLRRDTLGFVEFACVILSNVPIRLELLAFPRSEVLIPAESLTDGARMSTDGPLCLEWVGAPSLMMVAPERLLRSPGRIRVLSGPNSIHPLRGD